MFYFILQKIKTNLGFLTITFVLLVCVLHVIFVDGVRGSDQYWYLADVETLAKGLSPLTNNVFPGNVLRAGSADQSTYFAHNGPLLHIISWVTRLTDPVIAWKYMNLLFFLLAATFTGLTVAWLSTRAYGYGAVIVFLTTPINVWLAGNFLQEMFFCFLSSALLYCSVTDEGSILKKLCLFGALALGTLSHPLYLIVGCCYALFIGFVSKRWAISGIVIGTVLLSTALKDAWFPTSFPPSIKDLISASVPGIDNTIWQLSDTVTPISFQLLLDKLEYALKYQFYPSIQTPLYLATNLGLVSILILFTKFRKKKLLFLYVCAVFMLSYAGMIVLTQNQVRYQLFITPAAIACTVLWISTWRFSRLNSGLVVVVLIAYVVIDAQMLWKIRDDSRMERKALSALSEQLAFISSDSRVALVGKNLGGWLSIIYTLRPVEAMPVLLNLLDDGKFAKVIELFKPDYILVKNKLPVDEISRAKFMFSLENQGLFDIDVYKMGQPAD